MEYYLLVGSLEITDTLNNYCLIEPHHFIFFLLLKFLQFTLKYELENFAADILLLIINNKRHNFLHRFFSKPIWFSTNKLHLNTDKTKSLVFSTSHYGCDHNMSLLLHFCYINSLRNSSVFI